MNEPLTNISSPAAFTGKSYNKHPQWYNQPLRLTDEQKRDPLPVFDDFFQCYHLNDIRKTLWEWITEILSSPCSISIEPQRRNDHIYFYEKIEGVIEAAFVIKNKIHRNRRKKEKQKLKKDNHPTKDHVSILKNSINPDKSGIAVELENGVSKFNIPKKLIEFVNENPIYVITEVFKNESLTDLKDQLQDWLLIALSADCAFYEEGEHRGLLLSLQSQMLVLLEALFIINKEYLQKEGEAPPTDKTMLLSQEQIANPIQVISTFFENFPVLYILRELEDWLEASICFSGTPPQGMHNVQALLTYRNVLCLIKSANRLLDR